MPPSTDQVLFQAISTPQRHSRPRLRTLALLALLPATAIGTMFLLLGAWPVMGFMGLEAGLVVALVALHRRNAAQTTEMILLTPDSLRVLRAAGARREEHALPAYWARVTLTERPGRVSELTVSHRGESIEIGRFLAEEEKRDLAGALEAALASLRSPRFDNPQLRQGA